MEGICTTFKVHFQNFLVLPCAIPSSESVEFSSDVVFHVNYMFMEINLVKLENFHNKIPHLRERLCICKIAQTFIGF